VGAASTVVSVEAQAPILQTETTSLGQLVDSVQIQSTPLNGRNYIQLAMLGAGTTPAVGASERNSFYANGVREIQNSYLLDGVDNKNKIVGFDNSAAQSIEPVIDSVQEFKVQTSTFSAEFGQAAGAVINVTTKSGTNEFHGSAFEYLRNSVFDADPYFQPARTAKPQFIQNQYGATFGGPVIKNRTFFFFGWQGTRTNDAAPQLATVPTDLQKEDNFTVPIYDPNTTIPNPNGSGYVRTLYPKVNGYYQIPLSQLDPVGQNLLSLFPEPNLSGAANYFSNQKETIAQDQLVGRVDHRFSDKDSIFFRYSTTRNTNHLPSVMPPPANNTITVKPAAHSFSTSETHIFSPYLINEIRTGYQETEEIQQADGPRQFDEYGIIGAPDYPQVHGLPTFTISGLTTIGTAGIGTLQTPATGSNNLPIDKEGRTIQANDNLTWIRGRHTLKFGFDFQQVALYANVTLNARRVYTQNPQSRTGTGSSFADFLLGETATATVGTRSDTESRQHIYQGYVQDDWKITSKLIVNAGLRNELPLPWYETSNVYTNLVAEPGPLYGTLLQANDASQYGYRNSFVNPNYSNFAPRLGFAYQLTPKTVVRAAAGIFFGRDENLAWRVVPPIIHRNM
jgi:TonB dependent receptor